VLQKILISLLLGLALGSSGCSKPKPQVDYSSGLRVGEEKKEYAVLTVPTIGPFECTEYGIPTKTFKPYDEELKTTIPANQPYFFEGRFETFNGKSAPVNVYIQILRSVNGKLEYADQMIGNTKFSKPRTLEDTSTFSFQGDPLKRGKYVAKIWFFPDKKTLYGTFTFHVE